MRSTRTVTEVARNFAEYVNRVAFHGERFVLVRGKRQVAELRPVPGGRRLSELPGLLAGLPRLGDAEAEAFEKEWTKARSGLSMPDVEDEWES